MKLSTLAWLLGSIFGVLSLVLLVIGAVLTVDDVAVAPIVLFVVGAIFAVVAIVAFTFAPRIRAQERLIEGTATPDAAAMQGWDRLHAEIERAFAGSPYAVRATPGSIRVSADLADARFLTIGGARRVATLFTTAVIPVRQGAVARQDTLQDLEWTVWVDGTARPRFTGKGRTVGGRVYTIQKQVEVGADAKGIGKKVDYTFSSAEIAKPLKAAIEAVGFDDVMPATQKFGVVMALAAGVPGVLVGIGAAIIAAVTAPAA
ncbi:hypothetical protein EXU48_14035 [Occultella glacieicola]|uniref:DUF3137 domain-containing protein n=1 Tax=Occultella glacieicola TaxID=2518684 RepID=A0ABY2E240_9MICO|nr:hypothetical protein [Occultella glacieicola]TDE92652.1 hypothetical protein EXU48_14035 [Occultella glacieicola]